MGVGNSSAPPPPSPLDPLAQAHSAAKAQHDKISSAATMLGKVRTELDTLVNMGTAVSDEDVLQGMSKLVSAGADPKVLIALMSGDPSSSPPKPPMPESGEALASWLQQQDQVLKQQESQIAPAQQVASHQLGVTALQYLAGHHMVNGPKAPVPNTPGPTTLQ